MILKRELVSSYSHLAAAVISVMGTINLVQLTAHSPILCFVSAVFGSSITFQFLASFLYHAKKRSDDENSFWRKLDHTAIFFTIAGTYTSVSYLYLSTYWFIAIVSAQWALVIFGIFFKFFYLHSSRMVYTLIYLAMGWMAIIPIKPLYETMPLSQFLLVLGGGVAYSIGAIFYALKRPVIKKDFFGFHEIFHILIIVGAALHYILIYRGMALLQSAM